MKKFAVLAMAAFACVFVRAAAETTAGYPDGQLEAVVYTHTLRKPVSIKNIFHFWNIKPDSFEVDKYVSTKGFSAKTGKSENMTLVFSNKLSVYIGENSEFGVEKFKMSERDLTDKYSNLSNAVFSVKKGTFYFYYPDISLLAPFYVKTSLGTFEIKSSQAYLSDENGKVALAILDGNANFVSKSGTADAFISKESLFSYDGAPGGISQKNNRHMTIIQIDAIRKNIALAKTAQKGVCFYLDKSGKLAAKRIISVDFTDDRKN